MSQHTARTELVPSLRFLGIRPEMAVRHVGERRTIGRHVTAELDTDRPYLHRLLSQEVGKIFQSCTDIVSRDVIFPLHLLKRHSAGKTPYDHCDGESRTADYWPAPADGGIKDDPIL